MFVDVATLAELAGISERKARKAVAQIASGSSLSWRGFPLEVKTVHGRGGLSGVRYLVKVGSLPPELQSRWSAFKPSFEGSLKPIQGRYKERSWWLHILGPVLPTVKGSTARRDAYEKILRERHTDWNGRPIQLTLRLLQRRMERMENAGSTVSLVRSQRSDKGGRRTYISRAWDGAVRLPGEEKERIANALQQQIRNLVAGGATWSQTAELARRYLIKSSQHAFPLMDAAELLRICSIPKALIQAELHYRKVSQAKTDRKAIEDTRPRIKRTIAGLRPMELVVMDVHPIDIAIQRPDGSEAHPRLLGFLDLATHRCWCELIFFDNRGGVRNVDLIDAFVRMARHPAFGLPEQVYCDNGSEYRFAAFLDDAMQIARPGSGRNMRVINALPYNASAKPIEQWFGRFEAQFLKHLAGYRGGNRMDSRQEAVGRKVAPFQGGFEAFHDTFFGLLRAYEALPMSRGELGKQSPSQAFAKHRDAGWTAVVMDPENLRVAFSRTETRDVRQGTISVGSRNWTSDALQAFQGKRVNVWVPAYHGYNELLVEDMQGNSLGIVTPDEVFSYLDPRGAQASAERTKRHHAGRAKLRSEVQPVNMAAELTAIGATAEVVTPNMPRDVVRIGRDGPQPKFISPRSDPETQAEAKRREKAEVKAARDAVFAAMERKNASAIR